ncbi:MAG: 30S ribosomal protein S10 [Nitrososphaerales archaeon]|jgi:small subunit ribosomal protein S10|nr:30S ribosomal protein S10 [Nitrososphaerales archaeon]|tara:strand:- start:415 stop:729 length:315 start_codon:yes stop_codon:yes gene_type:complete
MPQIAKIKLTSANVENLTQVCNDIKGMTEKTGVKVRGPQPLPTKKLKIVTRKAPSGQGTNTYDRYEMRVHRRLIDMNADDRTMRQLMKLQVPEDVFIEVNLSNN